MKLSEIVKAIKTDKLEVDVNLETTGVFIGLVDATNPQNADFCGTIFGKNTYLASMIANTMVRHDSLREVIQDATELYFRLRKEGKNEK